MSRGDVDLVLHDDETSKSAIIQARISCRRSNLVKIISEPSATRYMAFEVIRSNIEIAPILPRIARLRSSSHRRCTAYVQGQKSKVKVTTYKVRSQVIS